MKIKEAKKIKKIPQKKISFPFKLYLQQLFSTDVYVKFINPFNFWRKYQIKHLESCLKFDNVQHLEKCYQVRCQLSNFGLSQYRIICDKEQNIIKLNIQRKKVLQKKTLTFQHILKFKYRGVAYYKKIN